MKSVNLESIKITDLIGLKVKHQVTNGLRKDFGIGKIVDIKENRLYVDFETVGRKQFVYPVCFLEHLVFIDAVKEDMIHMVDCDIENYHMMKEKEIEDMRRKADVKYVKTQECNYFALKRPYVDLNYYCSKLQIKSNVNAKFTMCQCSKCKDCSLGKIKYDELVKEYETSGGCQESLISSNNMFKLSKRNKITVGDVVLFTCIPMGFKEQDRMVYGYSVVLEVIDNPTYYEIKLDSDKTYFMDYESASNCKFWDVMVNVKKPEVMLFGNSHCKKLTDMQMAQYLRMLYDASNDEELYSKYKDMLSYVGVLEEEIVDNNGALIQAETELEDNDLDEENDEDEGLNIKPRGYVRDEESYDDVDDEVLN